MRLRLGPGFSLPPKVSHTRARKPEARYAAPMRSLLTATVISTIALAGCSREESAERPEPVGFIAVVGAGDNHPLWPVLAATASRHVAAWQAMPVRIEAPPRVSSNAQNQLIRKLEAEGMRALCVQVVDVDASRSLLELLRRRGVVVVTMIDEVRVSPPFHHCGWDEHALGEKMAVALGEALYGRGLEVISDPKVGIKEIAIIAPSALIASMSSGDQAESAGAAIRRYRGFRSALSKRRAIEVLEECPCDDPAELPAAIRDIHKRFPTLDGWVLADGWSADDVPTDVANAIQDRIVLTAHAFPSMWPLTETEARVIAVGADYGSIAPHALDQAHATLRGGMSRRRKTEVDLVVVVTERGWTGYREQYTGWLAENQPEDKP